LNYNLEKMCRRGFWTNKTSNTTFRSHFTITLQLQCSSHRTTFTSHFTVTQGRSDYPTGEDEHW